MKYKIDPKVDADAPPKLLQIEEMKPVMATLKQFSENQEDFLLYASRRIAQIEKNTQERRKRELLEENQELSEAKKELLEEKQELSEENQELSEKVDHLKSLLKQQGIDPDSQK